MNNKKTLSVIILTIVLLIISCVLSVVVTCGIIKLITICFGLKFKWSVAIIYIIAFITLPIWIIPYLIHCKR